MKRIVFLVSLIFNFNTLYSQTEKYLKVHKNDGTAQSFNLSQIDSITLYSTGGTTCPGIPIVLYAGTTYNTVQIATQCWLRENIDVGTMINGNQTQTNNGIIEKYCYNDDPNNCNTYGGLYQWNEMMQYVTTPGTKGICPDGWHIPTASEFYTLRAAVGNNSTVLKAIGQGTGSGAGTNTSGFSALLVGDLNLNGEFDNLGLAALFFGSDGCGTPDYYICHMQLFHESIEFIVAGINKDYGLSVRCIKN